MDRRHDLAPELGGGVAVDVHDLGNVIAGPDHGGVIRGDARKPAVLIFAGGAGLARHGDGPELGLGAGAALHALPHHIGHAVGRVGIKGGDGLGRIVDDHVAPGVGDHGIGAGVGENAVVDQGAVGLGHLPDGDAVGQLAQGHGGIAHVVLFPAGDQARKAEALGHIVDGGLGPVGENIHQLGGNGVAGPLERLGQGQGAVILVVVVVGIPARAAQIDVGAVVDDGVGRDQALVDGRGIGGQRLDGRAGGADRAAVVEAVHHAGHGAVELKALGLLADAAGQGQNAPVVGVHDHDGALQLLAAAGLEIAQVGVDGVHHRLDVGVDAGVDLVTAVVKQRFGGVVADALQGHQILQHIVDDDLFIIGVGPLHHALDAGGALEHQFLGTGRLVGVKVDVLLLVHLAQDDLLPLFVVVLVVEGIVIGGLVGDAHDGGALGQAQVFHVLAKIGLGRGLHAVAALPEIDRIEIPFHDLLLVVFLFQLQRAEYLAQLALDGDLALAGQVLDELLGDGGAAVAGLHLGEHLDEGGGGAEPVYALVLIKALVLDGHQGLLHVFGNVLIVDPDALGLVGQGDQLLIFAGGVLVPDGAGLAELIVLQREVHLRGQKVFDVVGENTGEQQPRDQQDQHEGAEDLENRTDHG